MSSLTPEQIAYAKDMGFLKNTTNDGFSMRVITKNGVLTASQLKNISEISEKWGNSTIALTTRLTAELPAIAFEDIDTVREYLARDGMISGGTGKRVRPVVSCKGTVCKFGNVDTQALALKIHDEFFNKYYNVVLPHKFKIAVGGCMNNCVKPDLNDFGIVGVHPKMTTTQDGCERFKIYIGGRWGKKRRIGDLLPNDYTEQEVIIILDNSIEYFLNHANSGERFGTMLDRIGVEEVIKAII